MVATDPDISCPRLIRVLGRLPQQFPLMIEPRFGALRRLRVHFYTNRASSASIFDHGIEMMQLDPFRQFGPFFFTQTDHIELLHNHPSQLMPSSLLGGNLSCLCITLNSY